MAQIEQETKEASEEAYAKANGLDGSMAYKASESASQSAQKDLEDFLAGLNLD